MTKKIKIAYSFEVFYYVAMTSDISIDAQKKEILQKRGRCIDGNGNDEYSNVGDKGTLASIYLKSDGSPSLEYQHLFVKNGNADITQKLLVQELDKINGKRSIAVIEL